MDPESLASVRAIVRAGTFSAAAVELNLSQPALSRRIARLERELGGRLFDRLPRQAVATPLGLSVADAAARVEGELKRARDEARAVALGSAGRIRMSSLAGGIPILAAGLARFQARYPNVWVELRALGAPDAVAALRDRDVELATLPGSSLEPGMRSRKLARWRVVLAVRPDHPFAGRRTVTLQQLATEPALMLAPEFMVTQHVLDAAVRAGLRLRLRLIDGTTEAVIALARRGLGAGVLPDAVRLPPGLVSVPLATKAAAAEFDYVLAWLADRTLHPGAGDLIDVLARETAPSRQ